MGQEYDPIGKDSSDQYHTLNPRNLIYVIFCQGTTRHEHELTGRVKKGNSHESAAGAGGRSILRGGFKANERCFSSNIFLTNKLSLDINLASKYDTDSDSEFTSYGFLI